MIEIRACVLCIMFLAIKTLDKSNGRRERSVLTPRRRAWSIMVEREGRRMRWLVT